MVKKLSNGWIRDQAQENDSVFRWYENPKRGITASMVQGARANEGEWRISQRDFEFDSIQSRGGKSLMLKKSDAQNISKIETLIRREKMRK